MNILLAMLIFGVIIIIHELGHFLLARVNGVEVTEFSIGMGPRIVTLVKTAQGLKVKFFVSNKVFETSEGWEGRTKYSLKILPFGGSCIMLGEDDVVDAENAFCKKNVYQRMSIVFAGPFFNFVLAFVLAIIINSVAGFDKPVVTSVDDNMPMKEAGVQVGDEIVKINNTKIVIDREIGSYFMFNPITENEAYTITLMRDGKEYSVDVTAKQDVLAEGETPVYRLGFRYGSPRQKGTVIEVLKYSVYEVKYWIVTTVKSLGMLVTGKLGKDDISGPVGIVSTVGDLVEESSEYGISNVVLTLIYFSILLSANLGVMNLLPIPALDGGRLFFQLIEVIRRKPIDPEKEGVVTMVGFMALMALMIFVLFNDIQRLITG